MQLVGDANGHVPGQKEATAKPASTTEVSTDSTPPTTPSRAPTTSAFEPYREPIEPAVAVGHTAMAIWQDLVDAHRLPAR